MADILPPLERRWFDRAAFDIAHAHLDGVDRKLALHRAIAAFNRRPPIPASLRSAVYERDGKRCVACGTTQRLSLDHIQPYSYGGQDALENLQTMCLSCNCRKADSV